MSERSQMLLAWPELSWSACESYPSCAVVFMCMKPVQIGLVLRTGFETINNFRWMRFYLPLEQLLHHEQI